MDADHRWLVAARALTEAELMTVCYAPPTDPSRENGLWLKQMRRGRKDMTDFFGDLPPPTFISPTGSEQVVQSARIRDSPKSATLLNQQMGKKSNRASTISVLSALGVPGNNDSGPKSSIPKSPSASSFLGVRGKRMYNFFGHRPPSELISNHLVEYFPSAKKKDLEKGYRNSMLRLDSKGDIDFGRQSMDSARTSAGRNSMEGNRLPSRFSIASSAASSNRMSRASSHKASSTPPSAVIPEESELLPRLSVSGDGDETLQPEIDGEGRLDSKTSGPPLLPAFQPSGESLSESLSVYEPGRPLSMLKNRRNSASSAKSRYSTISQRRPRPKSIAASLLTVDEITAEVENRRSSVIAFVAGDDDADATDEQLLGPATARLSKIYDPGLAPTEGDESEEEEEYDSEEEEESEEESEDDSDEEDEDEAVEEVNTKDEEEHGKAFTSTGCTLHFPSMISPMRPV